MLENSHTDHGCMGIRKIEGSDVGEKAEDYDHDPTILCPTDEEPYIRTSPMPTSPTNHTSPTSLACSACGGLSCHMLCCSWAGNACSCVVCHYGPSKVSMKGFCSYL